ncbi:MAG: 2-oxoacid:acceptor oxidoreductase family protein [Candidatus Heimdallarchaeota archaeon]|nr:2-oxoacid:acceptor oxidoreductase family protein [Candidatus Heimdallarchaeota archaeon]MDH5645541.1 2-oxoacid:acceptor oxidoreductase family protein [Candidatus Heimdallarchaeota archaeon]
MKEYDITILSRGGQGGVTLGKVLAYTATYDGFYATAIPKYGAERRGAPISTSVRIYDRPVKRHAQIEVPTDVITLDVSLMTRMFPQDIFQGTGSLTINADSIPIDYEIYQPEKLGYSNIQKITQEFGLVKSGSSMIGIPTLGAFIATSGILSMNSLHKAIDKLFSQSEYLDANHKAVDRSFEQTEVVKYEGKIIQ